MSPGDCRSPGKGHHILFVVAAISSLVLDLVSKWLVFRWDRSTTLIPGFLDISCETNKGAVFGILAGHKALLLVLSALAVLIILGMQFRGMRPTLSGGVSMGLLLGGALGNIYDRLALGHVRDFVILHVGEYRWPTFNLADAFLCAGAGLLVLKIVKDETPSNVPREEEKTSESPPRNS